MCMVSERKPLGHGCGTGADSDSDENIVLVAGSANKQVALEKVCAERMSRRKLGEEYSKRLSFELEQIAAQGNAGYLIDLARHCRSEGVQYGNENGLLVEWLLNITPQDPVRDNIPHRFRFFGDAPDVDLDFDSARKPEVEAYLKRKYGEDHVVHIGAYGTFSSKSAIKEMARVYGLMETATETEMWFSKFAKTFDPYDPLSKETMDWNLKYVFGDNPEGATPSIPQSPWTKAEIEEGRRFREKHNEIFELAAKITGQITHFTAHAAGVGIFPKPAWQHMPLKWNSKKKQIQTALQEGTRFKEITQAGIIKIDVLGLTLNSVMAMSLRLILERHGLDLWDAIWPKCPRVTREMIDAGQVVLDIDDPAILEEAREGHNIGSFQFAGAGISRLLRRIHPDSFEDIVAANALYRPGTISAGEAEAFAWRKANMKRRQHGADALSAVEKKVLAEGYLEENGKRVQKYTDYARMHPAFAEILADTHGSLVYQEQVMTTFAKTAGFSLEDADGARKTLVKASQAPDRKERLAALSRRAAAGAGKCGMSPSDVDKLVDVLAKFSGYSFNKSHSASYALAYSQVQFFKIYYPIEFAAALLSFSKNSKADKKRDDDADIHLHICEAKRLGFQVVRPLCNHAVGEFTIHKSADLDEHLFESERKSKGDEVLMWGLRHLHNIGEKQAAAIMATYPVRDLEDFCDRVDGRVVNKNVIGNLIRIGFFDTLYEDDQVDMRRVLAWRHYHEDRGMMTMEAAVQQVYSQYQESKNTIASLTLTRRNLVAIEALEEKARVKAKELREAGKTKAVQEVYRRKRERTAQLDPHGERKTLKALLREIEKCRKTKKKLGEKKDSVVYTELVDDLESRIEAERDVYGENMYTNALMPHISAIKALAKWTPKHIVTIPEAVDRIPPARRQSVTVVGELKSIKRWPYTDRSGKRKMRIVGKLAGRKNTVVINLVAFDISDDIWAAAKGVERQVVAVTGRLGEYDGSPQIVACKRTEWLRRFGVEPFGEFEPAFRKCFSRRK